MRARNLNHPYVWGLPKKEEEGDESFVDKIVFKFTKLLTGVYQSYVAKKKTKTKDHL